MPVQSAISTAALAGGHVPDAVTYAIQSAESQYVAGGIAALWMVYLFCDDTAFVASDSAMMDMLLNCYKTFTIRWRIRVNPWKKCKVMCSEQASRAHQAPGKKCAEPNFLAQN